MISQNYVKNWLIYSLHLICELCMREWVPTCGTQGCGGIQAFSSTVIPCWTRRTIINAYPTGEVAVVSMRAWILAGVSRAGRAVVAFVTWEYLVCDATLGTEETCWTFSTVRLTSQVVIEACRTVQRVWSALRAVVPDWTRTSDSWVINCQSHKAHIWHLGHQLSITAVNHRK